MSIDTLNPEGKSLGNVDEAGVSAELTAGVEDEGAKEWGMECGCLITIVDPKIHAKHKGVKKEGCYQCISKMIGLEPDWKAYYAKYAGSRAMTGLRDAFKKGTGSDPSDKTVMTLYKCALAYPNVQVRAYVHCKYGGVVLEEVERAHYALQH